MVSQRDLIAAQLLGLAVQTAPAHPGAEVAWVLLAAIGHLEHVRFKDSDRHLQQGGVLLDLSPVDLVIAGIHHQIDRLEGDIRVLLQLLHQLRHQHGVLATGDAHGDFIPCLNQLIALYR